MSVRRWRNNNKLMRLFLSDGLPCSIVCAAYTGLIARTHSGQSRRIREIPHAAHQHAQTARDRAANRKSARHEPMLGDRAQQQKRQHAAASATSAVARSTTFTIRRVLSIFASI